MCSVTKLWKETVVEKFTDIVPELNNTIKVRGLKGHSSHSLW